MRLNRVIGVAAALALGGTVGLLPGLASGSPPSSASFSAQDFSWQVSGGGANSVTVALGGVVSFNYPSGISMHNASFDTAPSSCTQSAPVSGSVGAALPPSPSKAGWAGSCMFNTPGVYTFHCMRHPSMMGAVNVADASGTVPTSTTTPAGTTTAGTTTLPPGGSTTGRGNGSAGMLPTASISVAHLQRGGRLQGSVLVAVAGSRVRIDALATSASLATAAKRARVRVGRFERASSPAGRLRFSIGLSARAKRALHRRNKLAVTVAVALTAPRGAPRRLSSSAVLKP